MRLYHVGAKVRLKDDASPVTEAYKASEAIVIDALQRLAPNIPIVSEEIAGDRSADLGPRFFLVDPLRKNLPDHGDAGRRYGLAGAPGIEARIGRTRQVDGERYRFSL